MLLCVPLPIGGGGDSASVIDAMALLHNEHRLFTEVLQCIPIAACTIPWGKRQQTHRSEKD